MRVRPPRDWGPRHSRARPPWPHPPGETPAPASSGSAEDRSRPPADRDPTRARPFPVPTSQTRPAKSAAGHRPRARLSSPRPRPRRKAGRPAGSSLCSCHQFYQTRGRRDRAHHSDSRPLEAADSGTANTSRRLNRSIPTRPPVSGSAANPWPGNGQKWAASSTSSFPVSGTASR